MRAGIGNPIDERKRRPPSGRAGDSIGNAPACHSVLMVGTRLDTRGGIASVVQGYRRAGLFDRYDCKYVVTHRDGSRLAKVTTALSAWFRVGYLLIQMDRPLVHIHLSSRASFWRKAVVCELALAAGRPYLLHVHGSEFMRFYDYECGPSAKAYVARLFRRSARVLALSEQWRTDLLRICPEIVVEVLPNAVALPSSLADVGNRPDGTVRIVSLGRLGERKGSFDLVRAFERVLASGMSARLVCAGDGAIEDVRQLARDLRMNDHVECPGWLGVEEARQLLSESQVFALPSHAEGLPMALLEAMACGLPVLVTPVGGMPQVVSHECNGLVVPTGDTEALAEALGRLVSDEGLRRRLGTAARETIAQAYSLEQMVERLAAIYHQFGVARQGSASA